MAITVADQNKALFRRWFEEAWNKGRYEIASEIVAPGMTVHGAGGQAVKQGPDGVVELIKTWRTAFPDGQMNTPVIFTEGELIAALLLWSGTHLGDFYGIPPSGKKVDVMGVGIDRIVDGKIVEGWGEVDMLGLMRQVGAVPPLKRSAPPQKAGGRQAAPYKPAQTFRSAPPDNKSVVLQFAEAINGWNMDEMREVVDVETYIEHSPSWGPVSFEGSIQTYSMFRKSVPNLHFAPDLNLLVGEGEYVATRGFLTGTHVGADLFGVPASGKKLDWTGIDISRVINGKIVERWPCADLLRLSQQLGIIPA
ncbi:MAG TPA: ester cyclase [Ktedonosporobacter sp.]|nr:ester cyclase [Ktedonosporobacter sp.]